jgi:hypothetical protein
MQQNSLCLSSLIGPTKAPSLTSLILYIIPKSICISRSYHSLNNSCLVHLSFPFLPTNISKLSIHAFVLTYVVLFKNPHPLPSPILQVAYDNEFTMRSYHYSTHLHKAYTSISARFDNIPLSIINIFIYTSIYSDNILHNPFLNNSSTLSMSNGFIIQTLNHISP